MKRECLSSNSFYHQANAELFQTVMQSTNVYPWNPQDPDVEQFFTQLEDGLAETVVPDVRLKLSEIMVAQLRVEFAERCKNLPEMVLRGIVQKAMDLADDSLSLADQLVSCIQECFPQWSTDDLYVLARPYAHSMRGGELRQVAYEVSWQTLSQLDQVRVGFEIARLTFEMLDGESC